MPRRTSLESHLPSWSRRKKRSNRDRWCREVAYWLISFIGWTGIGFRWLWLYEFNMFVNSSSWVFNSFFLLFDVQIEQEKIDSLRKVDEDKREKESKERAQSKSPKRLVLDLFLLPVSVKLLEHGKTFRLGLDLESTTIQSFANCCNLLKGFIEDYESTWITEKKCTVKSSVINCCIL